MTGAGKTLRTRPDDPERAWPPEGLMDREGSLTASVSAWAEAGQQRVIQPTEAESALPVVAPLEEAADEVGIMAAVEGTRCQILARLLPDRRPACAIGRVPASTGAAAVTIYPRRPHSAWMVHRGSAEICTTDWPHCVDVPGCPGNVL
jgi:hypothetical protein